VSDPASQPYEFGDFRLDARRRLLVRKDGEVVALTPKAFDVLLFLVERPGATVTKEELLSSVWPDTAIEESNLSQNIYTIRRALGEERGEHQYIATVPGRGYQFVAPVHSSSQPEVERFPKGRRWIVPLLVVAVALATIALIFTRQHPEPVRSLAVLPFKPLAAAQRDESLELGMTETMITNLNAIDELTIRPLGVVRPFAGLNQDPLAAGRSLGVDAVLDGHIQRSGDRIRITARLFDVDEAREIWSGRFEEQFTNIFSVQDAIARRVVSELALRLSREEDQRLARRPTINPRAYDLYMKGRFFVGLAQPQRAIEVFEEAAQLDPQFALAHAGLADIYSRLPIAAEVPSNVAIPKAKEALERAFAADPNLAEAFAAQGWIEFYYEWNWEKSEQSFRRALALRSDDFSAKLGLAHLLSNMGRTTEALATIDEAIAIDPQSPIAAALKGQFLFHARRYDDARAQLVDTIEDHPAFWIAHLALGRTLSALNLHDEALAATARARASNSSTTTQASEAIVLTNAGRRDDALIILRRLETESPSPYNVALVHQAVGDTRSAFKWLERARAEKDVRLVFLGVDPVWNNVARITAAE
jgi:DNA-binding winged helix-turn-helix (wHTH) protein/TolB-like protein/Tfp pilus assembly protein PilF